MGVELKSRSVILSQIVDDLSATSKSGGELSTAILRLRDEIQNGPEREETVFGKFRRLLDSLREIIPDEKQRYHAAVTAMTATSKLGPEVIVQAAADHLRELKIIEKGLLSSLPARGDEVQAMEARARELRDDTAKLRETLARLEREEQEILAGVAARQRQTDAVEKEVGKLFAELGADAAGIKKKIELYTAEGIMAQPVPTALPVQPAPAVAEARDIFPDLGNTVVEQRVDRPAASPQKGSESMKRCPMCGGNMDFRGHERMWLCTSCGYGEPGLMETESRQVMSGLGEAGLNSASPPSSAPPALDPTWQKKCSMCGGEMNYHGADRLWKCYTCGYEETQTGERPDARETDQERSQLLEPARPSRPISITPSFPASAPLMFSSKEDPIRGSIQDMPPAKPRQVARKKVCPSCRKKMNWHEAEQTWRCSFCEYERSI